ncbi:glycine-rich cell wall structural protein 1.8-like [Penaeus chinensis]|uniref:glycine-rich cell wall structural protein 1.8-like n=1 Tax=Penaeus chinensis TaxID=139456 RepID=UPI001FB5E799|nr:glycine-rich cell wall structural protein 1.8-like [Penaeus chinensis]
MGRPRGDPTPPRVGGGGDTSGSTLERLGGAGEGVDKGGTVGGRVGEEAWEGRLGGGWAGAGVWALEAGKSGEGTWRSRSTSTRRRGGAGVFGPRRMRGTASSGREGAWQRRRPSGRQRGGGGARATETSRAEKQAGGHCTCRKAHAVAERETWHTAAEHGSGGTKGTTKNHDAILGHDEGSRRERGYGVRQTISSSRASEELKPTESGQTGEREAGGGAAARAPGPAGRTQTPRHRRGLATGGRRWGGAAGGAVRKGPAGTSGVARPADYEAGEEQQQRDG